MSGKFVENQRVLTSVISWTLGRSPEKNTPYVRVTLDGGINWTGWLGSDKSKAITLDALKVMGFKGTAAGQLKFNDALDTQRSVIAVIAQPRLYKGKEYYDAKFINRAPQTGFKGADEDVLAEMDGIDIRHFVEDFETPPEAEKVN